MAEINPQEDDSNERIGLLGLSHDIHRSKLRPGDNIYCYRLIPVPPFHFQHHGIYVGKPDAEVIHFDVLGHDKYVLIGKSSSASIIATDLDTFLKGSTLRLVAYNVSTVSKLLKEQGTTHTVKSRNVDVVVETAEYYLEHPDEFGKYDLITNNCEHFAYHCKTGEHLIAGQSSRVVPFVGPVVTDLVESVADTVHRVRKH